MNINFPLPDYISKSTNMSEKSPLRVVITGAAGQIAYSLIYQVASGYVFGEDQVKVQYIANYSCPVLI